MPTAGESDMELESGVRPWGSWRVLDMGDGYKVKRIEVQPHQRLSYQTHEHRAEHWVVVSGNAICLIDGTSLTVGPGHCVDIGVGQAHRIANNDDDIVVLIETQTGSYTGEDDITRLDDDYGRAVPRE